MLQAMDAFANLLHETIVLCVTLALPVLLAATGVGVIVAIVQAATQIQEQTLTLLPKILAVGLVLVLFGGFGFALTAKLFNDAVSAMPQIARASPSQ